MLANGLLHGKSPAENLLVSKTVKGTGKTEKSGRVGEVRVRKSRTDKVGSVGRNVSTLVVTVDGNVKTEVVGHTLVVTVADHVGVVTDQVKVRVDGLLAVTTAEDVVVDTSGNGGELGNEVDRVVKDGGPVLGLLDTLGVSSGELGVVVKSSDGSSELGHGVESLGERVDDLLDVGGQGTLSSELSRETLDLLLGGDVAGQKEPEHGLGDCIASSGEGKMVCNKGQRLVPFKARFVTKFQNYGGSFSSRSDANRYSKAAITLWSKLHPQTPIFASKAEILSKDQTLLLKQLQKNGKPQEYWPFRVPSLVCETAQITKSMPCLRIEGATNSE